MMPKLNKSEIETLLFFESLGDHWCIVGNRHAIAIRSLHQRGLVRRKGIALPNSRKRRLKCHRP